MKSLSRLLARFCSVKPITSSAHEFRRFTDQTRKLLRVEWVGFARPKTTPWFLCVVLMFC